MSPVVRPPAPAPSLLPEPHSVPGVPGLFVLLAGGGMGVVVVSASFVRANGSVFFWGNIWIAGVTSSPASPASPQKAQAMADFPLWNWILRLSS